MQKTLDKIIGGIQTVAIKKRTIPHIPPTIRDTADPTTIHIPPPPPKAHDGADLDFIPLALKKFGHCKKFYHMIKVCHNNIESKIKRMTSYLKPLLSNEAYVRVAHFPCCYTLLLLKYLQIL